MVDSAELRTLIDLHPEWLLVRDAGKAFPLGSSEIEISAFGGRTLFGFLDDSGFHSWRLNGYSKNDEEILVDVAGAFARKREQMRLVPRQSAAELSAAVEIARLKKANEIGELLAESFVGLKLVRVGLNSQNGRIAQIEFETKEKVRAAAIADVTSLLTAEDILTSAITWLEKLVLRKRPVTDIWLVGEKRQARNAQKLLALLSERWHRSITICEIDRKPATPVVVKLRTRKMGDLWREKAPSLVLPVDPQPSETARRIMEIAPGEIDRIMSRQGETLRFHGLPFARIRAMMGQEKAWFGTGRERRILNHETWELLAALVDELKQYRSFSTPNKRHEFFRMAPEAWLESILRRNIKLLDGNLVLSPIYNQFRTSNDKIDLLALRKDGRLVVIELKTQPDRGAVFQVADYWRKIELQRRRGILKRANLFEGREIIDRPALLYLAAPAWSFHRDFEFFARCLNPAIELWRFELHENWRENVRVLARENYTGIQ